MKNPLAAGHPRGAALTAVLLTCIAYFCFTASDGVTKAMSAKYHLYQTLFVGAAFSVLFNAVYGLAREGRRAFMTRKPGLMALRALLSQGVVACNIVALPHVRLTTFYTLVFTSPFWIALLSVLFMKDRVTMARGLAIAAGFGIVLFVFSPGGGLLDHGAAALVLLGAFCYSCQLLVMRRIGTGESRAFMFMCGAGMSLLWVLPFLYGHFVPMSISDIALFAGSVAVGLTGLYSIAHAFQTTPSPSLLAPYHYTQVVWGAVIGWLFFSEVPDARVMTGALLIIAIGLYLLRTEAKPRREPDAETAVEN